MANTTTIILKNSGTIGNTPSANNLEHGELALNYSDGILFYKNANNQVLSISGSSSVANTANAAYDQANTTRDHANGAFNQANTARTHANSAFNQANVTAAIANAAYDQANTTRDHANGAFNQANTARTHANSAFNQANVTAAIANAAFDKVNSVSQIGFTTIIANGVSLVADSNVDTLTILTQGNVSIVADATGDNLTFDLTSTGVVRGTYGSGTSIPVLTIDEKGRITLANTANIDPSIASAAFDKANTANIIANASFARANAANLIANLAFDKANTANVFAVSAFAAQNVTSGVANAAFNAANTMVMKTGNTMTGQLVMAVGVPSTSQNTGSIIINGGLGLSGNVYVSNSSYYGFANTSNVSVAKIQYNAACNSIDFVFG